MRDLRHDVVNDEYPDVVCDAIYDVRHDDLHDKNSRNYSQVSAKAVSSID